MSRRATATYAGPVDAALDVAYDALLAVGPMASLATRLSALGLDDRAVWSGPSADAGARGLGFCLLWRLGPGSGTAKIVWRAGLTLDGEGRTVLAVTVEATASDTEADERIAAAWPLVETIALAHARAVRRAVDERAGDVVETVPYARPLAASASARARGLAS